jgi:hypothetical protein
MQLELLAFVMPWSVASVENGLLVIVRIYAQAQRNVFNLASISFPSVVGTVLARLASELGLPCNVFHMSQAFFCACYFELEASVITLVVTHEALTHFWSPITSGASCEVHDIIHGFYAKLGLLVVSLIPSVPNKGFGRLSNKRLLRTLILDRVAFVGDWA